jgi:hypothetical protein
MINLAREVRKRRRNCQAIAKTNGAEKAADIIDRSLRGAFKPSHGNTVPMPQDAAAD